MGRRGRAGPDVAEGVDRFVRNVQHGRFEQALSGLTAGAALVNGAEIFLEHDRASLFSTSANGLGAS